MAITKKEKTKIIKELFKIIRLIEAEWKDTEPKRKKKSDKK